MDSVKSDAQAQKATPAPVSPPAIAQSQPESPELTNVMQGVKERATGTPPKPEAGTPQLTEDAVQQSMQDKRNAHAEGRDVAGFLHDSIMGRTMAAMGNTLGNIIPNFLDSGNEPLTPAQKAALPTDTSYEAINRMNGVLRGGSRFIQ
jgi:hypothetical protein